MKIQKVKISKVKLNPGNPRIIKDEKFEKLVNSIKEFPEMLEIRPIVVNEEFTILGGNMRYKACKEAKLKEIPIIVAKGLTEDQQKEFLIKDNTSGGEWDWNVLANEWEADKLEEWGLDSWEPEDIIEAKKIEEKDLSEDLKETFEVIIECGNEEYQEETYNKLIKEGYICRVLTL
jgi:ParB-like chromosome segregation protein Spo0J